MQDFSEHAVLVRGCSHIPKRLSAVAVSGPLTVFALVLGFTVFPTTHVVGQTAESFEQLRILVKAGNVVSVTDAAGMTSTGEVVELSNSSLRLRVGTLTRELLQADVLKIDQRRRDSLGNGALIGFLVGGGLAATAVLASCGNDRSYVNLCEGAVPLALIGMWGGLGAGVGVDALIVHSQTIYRAAAPVSSRVRVTPLLSAGRRGVLVSLSR
jgi:hypothetical protein